MGLFSGKTQDVYVYRRRGGWFDARTGGGDHVGSGRTRKEAREAAERKAAEPKRGRS